MENQHLKYFKVENFKRFESLEMNNIGQFNLIVGDNNVGKTSVLEALLVDADGKKFLNNLYYILTSLRKFDNLEDQYQKNYFLDYFLNDKNTDEQFLFKTETLEGIFIYRLINQPNSLPNLRSWNFNAQNLILEIDLKFEVNQKITKLNLHVPFVPFGYSYDHDLTKYYSTYIQLSGKRREKFLDALRKIVPQIKTIEVNAGFSKDAILLIGQNDEDAVLPLATFGDGFLKLFRLLISIIIHSGKRLMIDEIDTGIHYSRMKDFWKILIESSIDNQVQLFATTHSKEALQYYKEALEELGYQDKGRVIRLVEHKHKVVKAYTYTFEQFEHSIDYDNEIR
ncbi:MAG: AAA family ATPase [Flavobacterium sp.]|nr:AAA family ATPase [Flavobacterium sp.]